MDYDENNKHEHFCKSLDVYPFYSNNNKVWVMLLEDIDSETISFSLLNQAMLETDLNFFEQRNDVTVPYYKPYFYDFFMEGEINEKQKMFLKKYRNRWMEAKFVETDNPKADLSTTSCSFDGTIFFSASPFLYQRSQLIISDKTAPASLEDRINGIYNLKNTTFINSTKISKDMISSCITDVIGKASVTDIKVYNVGQGACNYIYFDNYKKVMFDIGYGRDKSEYNSPRLWKNHKKCKPHLMILSHWDLDHILGVTFVDDYFFNIPWIAPEISSKEHKVSSCRLARYLDWKGILYIIEPVNNGHNVFSNTTFELWKGIGIDNTNPLKTTSGKTVFVGGYEIKGLNKINNSGLIIKLSANSHTMLLPGDCEYKMLPTTLYNHKTRYDVLIVPHHGSRMYLNRCKRKTKKKEKGIAIISVGMNRYRPEHPWKSHIKFLERLRYKVLTTAKNSNAYKMICVDLVHLKIL